MTSGKRAAPGRHAGPARVEDDAAGPTPGRGPLLALTLGITATVVAWGYLVYLAIDFGTAARGGDRTGWWLLGLATVGAVACLFVGMLLVMRLIARIREPERPAPAPRPAGRRIAGR